MDHFLSALCLSHYTPPSLLSLSPSLPPSLLLVTNNKSSFPYNTAHTNSVPPRGSLQPPLYAQGVAVFGVMLATLSPCLPNPPTLSLFCRAPAYLGECAPSITLSRLCSSLPPNTDGPWPCLQLPSLLQVSQLLPLTSLSHFLLGYLRPHSSQHLLTSLL